MPFHGIQSQGGCPAPFTTEKLAIWVLIHPMAAVSCPCHSLPPLQRPTSQHLGHQLLPGPPPPPPKCSACACLLPCPAGASRTQLRVDWQGLLGHQGPIPMLPLLSAPCCHPATSRLFLPLSSHPLHAPPSSILALPTPPSLPLPLHLLCCRLGAGGYENELRAQETVIIC